MPHDPDWLSDTDPKARAVFLDLLRKMPPGEKLEAVFGLNRMLLALQESDVRRLYPNASGREVFLRVAARRLDRDTMIRVYAWDPKEHP